MLVITYAGLIVNTDFVAYIGLKRQEDQELKGGVNLEAGSHFQVILCLATGDAIVAATGLGQAAAQFLRQDLGYWWAEGNRAYDVGHALKRHLEGAYVAQDATQSTGSEGR